MNTARVCETCAYWDHSIAENYGTCRFPGPRNPQRATAARSSCTSYRPKVNYVGKKEAK